jgi:hypothetical protein
LGDNKWLKNTYETSFLKTCLTISCRWSPAPLHAAESIDQLATRIGMDHLGSDQKGDRSG